MNDDNSDSMVPCPASRAHAHALSAGTVPMTPAALSTRPNSPHSLSARPSTARKVPAPRVSTDLGSPATLWPLEDVRRMHVNTHVVRGARSVVEQFAGDDDMGLWGAGPGSSGSK